MDKKKLLVAFVIVALLIFAYMIVRQFTDEEVSSRLQSERQNISPEEYAAKMERLQDQLEEAREREYAEQLPPQI